MAIIGIDLGTTNSLAAYWQGDRPVLIPNVFGDHLTPSAVSLDQSGEVFVGKIALERLLSHPEQSAAVFKRSMGSRKTYRLGSKDFISEELSAMIIRKLREDAEEFLGEKVVEAIISVPAYFNDTQRRATKTAGELAGLKIERIVNEPTAAAVAYGLHERRDYTKFLVFDLGGGTFDISILEKYNNVMEVRAVAGDNFLGGEDFTDVLIAWFLMYHELEPEELSPIAWATLQRHADAAKCAFSENEVVELSCALDGEQYDMTFTLSEYERRCEVLFTRLRNPIRRVLSDSSLRLADLESILLVGGATKLPLVRNFVARLFGQFPAVQFNPEEVVAIGTAVHTALKQRNQSLNEVVLTDVSPYSLGTNVSMMTSSGFHDPGHFLPIIERNSVIPISRQERVYTVHDNQKTISVEVLQGESRRAADNILLGELHVEIPPAKAGHEAIDIRYTYDINGILVVDVTVGSTGITKTLVLEKNPGTLSPEEVSARLLALQQLKIHPRDKDENRLLMARAERIYEESLGEKRAIIGMEISRFEMTLNRQVEREIRDHALELAAFLKEIEDIDFM